MNTTIIYYIEINLVCIIILLLFQSQQRYKAEQFSNIRMVFSQIIWATIILCFADMISGSIKGYVFPTASVILEIFNLIFFEMITIISYLWLIYVLLKINTTKKLYRGKKILYALPLIIFSVVVLTNPVTHVLFAIDENNNYFRNNGVILHWIVTWFYLFTATYMTARAIIKEKNKLRRQEILPLLYFIIAPAVASMLQMFFYGISSIQVGITIAIVTICIVMQNNQVLTDALTGLNNRRGFDNYLEEHMLHHSELPITLLMIDLNKFKQVNDIFGHMMGDYALQDTADALKQACKEMPSRLFMCRYGGDEFIISGTGCSQEDIDKLIWLIHDELEKRTQLRKASYTLSVSIGVANGICTDSDDAEHLLRVADEAMYEDKKKSKK